MSIAQAAAQVIGTGMNMVNSNQDRQFNKGQAREADARALENSKALTMFNKEQQLDMIKDSKDVELKWMKDNGMNVGMMYNGSGSGGTTQVQTGHGQGTASNHKTPEVDMGSLGMAVQNAMMMQAQKENIEANTEKTKVETAKTAGVDTQAVQQGIQNAKAQEYVTRLEGYVKNASKEDAIDYIKWNMEKAEQEVLKEKNENYVSSATLDSQINTIRAKAIGAALENTLTRERTKLTTAQQGEVKARIDKMAADIAQNATKLGIEAQRMEIQKFAEEMKAAYPGLMNVIGDWADDAVRTIERLMGNEPDNNERRYDYKNR